MALIVFKWRNSMYINYTLLIFFILFIKYMNLIQVYNFVIRYILNIGWV